MSSPVRQGPPVDVPTERNPVPSSVSPIIVTHDLERLARFYTGVAGATQTRRTPDVGPAFYLGLRIGDSELGIVSDGSVEGAPAGRVMLSIELPDVDAALSRVEAHGGRAPAPANDMPWGQRVVHVQDPDGNAVNLTTTR
jgi:predicted enzyme related to lactoylglutathione lyase